MNPQAPTCLKILKLPWSKNGAWLCVKHGGLVDSQQWKVRKVRKVQDLSSKINRVCKYLCHICDIYLIFICSENEIESCDA